MTVAFSSRNPLLPPDNLLNVSDKGGGALIASELRHMPLLSSVFL